RLSSDLFDVPWGPPVCLLLPLYPGSSNTQPLFRTLFPASSRESHVVVDAWREDVDCGPQHVFLGLCAVDEGGAIPQTIRRPQEFIPYALVESHFFRLESVRGATSPCASKADLHRDIDEEGDIRHRFADDAGLELIEDGRRQPAACALERAAGQIESIADHPRAGSKRRPNDLLKMVCARCVHQQ